jgi:hypothetical protein
MDYLGRPILNDSTNPEFETILFEDGEVLGNLIVDDTLEIKGTLQTPLIANVQTTVLSNQSTSGSNQTDIITVNSKLMDRNNNLSDVFNSEASRGNLGIPNFETQTSDPLPGLDVHPVNTILTNTTNDKVWVCTDNSSGSAVWVEIDNDTLDSKITTNITNISNNSINIGGNIINIGTNLTSIGTNLTDISNLQTADTNNIKITPQAYTTNVNIGTSDENKLSLTTSGIERLTIDSDGELTILSQSQRPEGNSQDIVIVDGTNLAASENIANPHVEWGFEFKIDTNPFLSEMGLLQVVLLLDSLATFTYTMYLREGQGLSAPILITHSDEFSLPTSGEEIVELAFPIFDVGIWSKLILTPNQYYTFSLIVNSSTQPVSIRTSTNVTSDAQFGIALGNAVVRTIQINPTLSSSIQTFGGPSENFHIGEIENQFVIGHSQSTVSLDKHPILIKNNNDVFINGVKFPDVSTASNRRIMSYNSTSEAVEFTEILNDVTPSLDSTYSSDKIDILLTGITGISDHQALSSIGSNSHESIDDHISTLGIHQNTTDGAIFKDMFLGTITDQEAKFINPSNGFIITGSDDDIATFGINGIKLIFVNSSFSKSDYFESSFIINVLDLRSTFGIAQKDTLISGNWEGFPAIGHYVMFDLVLNRVYYRNSLPTDQSEQALEEDLLTDPAVIGDVIRMTFQRGLFRVFINNLLVFEFNKYELLTDSEYSMFYGDGSSSGNTSGQATIIDVKKGNSNATFVGQNVIGLTSGGVETNISSNATSSYGIVLPVAQGANSEILVNDGSGNLTWGSIADQTLNTTDDVAFESVNVGSIAINHAFDPTYKSAGIALTNVNATSTSGSSDEEIVLTDTILATNDSQAFTISNSSLSFVGLATRDIALFSGGSGGNFLSGGFEAQSLPGVTVTPPFHVLLSDAAADDTRIIGTFNEFFPDEKHVFEIKISGFSTFNAPSIGMIFNNSSRSGTEGEWRVINTFMNNTSNLYVRRVNNITDQFNYVGGSGWLNETAATNAMTTFTDNDKIKITFDGSLGNNLQEFKIEHAPNNGLDPYYTVVSRVFTELTLLNDPLNKCRFFLGDVSPSNTGTDNLTFDIINDGPLTGINQETVGNETEMIVYRSDGSVWDPSNNPTELTGFPTYTNTDVIKVDKVGDSITFLKNDVDIGYGPFDSSSIAADKYWCSGHNVTGSCTHDIVSGGGVIYNISTELASLKALIDTTSGDITTNGDITCDRIDVVNNVALEGNIISTTPILVSINGSLSLLVNETQVRTGISTDLFIDNGSFSVNGNLQDSAHSAYACLSQTATLPPKNLRIVDVADVKIIFTNSILHNCGIILSSSGFGIDVQDLLIQVQGTYKISLSGSVDIESTTPLTQCDYGIYCECSGVETLLATHNSLGTNLAGQQFTSALQIIKHFSINDLVYAKFVVNQVDEERDIEHRISLSIERMFDQ